VLSRNRKTFAVSSLVLNLFGSQIGEFFLPHPVDFLQLFNVSEYVFVDARRDTKDKLLMRCHTESTLLRSPADCRHSSLITQVTTALRGSTSYTAHKHTVH